MPYETKKVFSSRSIIVRSEQPRKGNSPSFFFRSPFLFLLCVLHAQSIPVKLLMLYFTAERYFQEHWLNNTTIRFCFTENQELLIADTYSLIRKAVPESTRITHSGCTVS